MKLNVTEKDYDALFFAYNELLDGLYKCLTVDGRQKYQSHLARINQLMQKYTAAKSEKRKASK